MYNKHIFFIIILIIIPINYNKIKDSVINDRLSFEDIIHYKLKNKSDYKIYIENSKINSNDNIKMLSNLCKKYEIPPDIIIDYIERESGFRVNAINPHSKAFGLFQIYNPNKLINDSIKLLNTSEQIKYFDFWLSGYGISSFRYDGLYFLRVMTYGPFSKYPLELQNKELKLTYKL